MQNKPKPYRIHGFVSIMLQKRAKTHVLELLVPPRPPPSPKSSYTGKRRCALLCLAVRRFRSDFERKRAATGVDPQGGVDLEPHSLRAPSFDGVGGFCSDCQQTLPEIRGDLLIAVSVNKRKKQEAMLYTIFSRLFLNTHVSPQPKYHPHLPSWRILFYASQKSFE